jgi:hypothetical protein
MSAVSLFCHPYKGATTTEGITALVKLIADFFQRVFVLQEQIPCITPDLPLSGIIFYPSASTPNKRFLNTLCCFLLIDIAIRRFAGMPTIAEFSMDTPFGLHPVK